MGRSMWLILHPGREIPGRHLCAASVSMARTSFSYTSLTMATVSVFCRRIRRLDHLLSRRQEAIWFAEDPRLPRGWNGCLIRLCWLTTTERDICIMEEAYQEVIMLPNIRKTILELQGWSVWRIIWFSLQEMRWRSMHQVSLRTLEYIRRTENITIRIVPISQITFRRRAMETYALWRAIARWDHLPMLESCMKTLIHILELVEIIIMPFLSLMEAPIWHTMHRHWPKRWHSQIIVRGTARRIWIRFPMIPMDISKWSREPIRACHRREISILTCGMRRRPLAGARGWEPVWPGSQVPLSNPPIWKFPIFITGTGWLYLTSIWRRGWNRSR